LLYAILICQILWSFEAWTVRQPGELAGVKTCSMVESRLCGHCASGIKGLGI